MAYTITKKENLDVEYFGYDTEFSITFQFEKQQAEVVIGFSSDKPNKADLISKTDGYHWLHFWLSQEPNTTTLYDTDNYNYQRKLSDLFVRICKYTIEDKESAIIEIAYDNAVTLEVVEEIAKIIDVRFAIRERFFEV